MMPVFINSAWPWRRVAEWTAILGALIYSLLFVEFGWGGVAAYVLALLPVVLAIFVSRTWLAGAFMALLPLYFVIGQLTADRPHHTPYLALDDAMPLQPAWMLVYGSLYVCAFLLPLLVIRGRELFHQALKAYLFVMVVSYLGFWVYPTIAPRNDSVAVTGFATWSLRLFYGIDQPYGCFPSLHVAYSFVAALACSRMHRGVGRVASAWAVLIGVSTVYTKQHYVVDAVAGGLEGVIAYFVFLRGRPRLSSLPIDEILAPRRALFAVAAYGAAIGGFWMAYQLGLGPVPR